MNICGRCVYALFAPMNCCLAPMKVGDSRRDRFIDKTTECFNGLYTENTRSQLKRQMFIERAKEALKRKDDD